MDNLKNNFETSFSDLKSHGYNSPFRFSDKAIGISIRKDFSAGYTSLIKIGILHPTSNILQELYISATYGKASNDGITFREKVRLTDPIDLVSSANDSKRYFNVHSIYSKDKYYYNKVTSVFFKNNNEISPIKVVDEIYEKHIKSTLKVRGAFLRISVWFWQTTVPYIFFLIYKLFHYILFFISGDRYTYNIFKEKGETNKNQFKESSQHWDASSVNKINAKDEESDKLNIFDYKASKWAIISYSLINIALYLLLFFYFKEFFEILKYFRITMALKEGHVS